MKKYLVAATCFTLVAGVVFAKKLNNEQKRLEECGVVMQEVLNVPDNIPRELLEIGQGLRDNHVHVHIQIPGEAAPENHARQRCRILPILVENPGMRSSRMG